MKKRTPASEQATKLATAICVELFGKHNVQDKDVQTIAAVIDREWKR